MKRAPIIESLKVSCGRCTLKELCFPRGMELSDMDELDKIIDRNMPMHKGEYLYQEGDDCKAIYAIRSGCVKTMIQSPSGEHQIIGFHLPGELVAIQLAAPPVGHQVVGLPRLHEAYIVAIRL